MKLIEPTSKEPFNMVHEREIHLSPSEFSDRSGFIWHDNNQRHFL